MLSNYLKKLESISKKFAIEKEILDIILYGSAVKAKETPGDIDILLIFLKEKLDNRLKIAHEFKEKIKEIKNIHLTTINIEELFDKSFLARQGILIEGYSLIHKIHFAERFGFNGSSLFTYNLKNLSHNQKTKFTYALIGRKKEGMIKLTNSIQLGRGAIAVPISKSIFFEDFLKEWKINYKERKILMEK